MLPTLQGYIFREMGRTALLTAIGLTAVLAMGGGVLNIIELEQITATQLLQILSIIVPVAATLALPVAALYGAAATYGRLSADNEFVACRSSGINIHVLFLPAVLISLVAAIITLLFINYFIPNRVRHLDELLRSNPARLVVQALQAPSRLPLSDRIRAYADEVEAIEENTGQPAVRLHRAAFIEMDDRGWARYGTAATVGMRLSDQGAWVDMLDVVLWDPRQGRWAQEQYMNLTRDQIPKLSAIRQQLKWLTLGELLRCRQRPVEIPKVREKLDRLRGFIAEQLVYRGVVDDFADDGVVHLAEGDVRYELSADEGSTDPESFKPSFSNVTLTVKSPRETRTGIADQAAFEVQAAPDGAQADAAIRLGKVKWTSSSNPRLELPKAADLIGPITLVVPDSREYSAERILEDATPLGLGKDLEHKREGLVNDMKAELRDIDGVIHSRLAFSGSVIALVILAAALGIIFRGAHILTSFGISFIPSLFVTVMIIMGRQLAKNEGAEGVGLGLMWAAIGAVVLVDAWVLTRVLRR